MVFAATFFVEIDVINDEAIINNGKCIGYVSSGGYAHYVEKSVAFGYIPYELSIKDTELEIEINGKLYSAKVITEPLYDPTGLKIRN